MVLGTFGCGVGHFRVASFVADDLNGRQAASRVHLEDSCIIEEGVMSVFPSLLLEGKSSALRLSKLRKRTRHSAMLSSDRLIAADIPG